MKTESPESLFWTGITCFILAAGIVIAGPMLKPILLICGALLITAAAFLQFVSGLPRNDDPEIAAATEIPPSASIETGIDSGIEGMAMGVDLSRTRDRGVTSYLCPYCGWTAAPCDHHKAGITQDAIQTLTSNL
jgi:hypothetical protein